MKTITIGTLEFNINNAQEKALYWDILELRDWIENAIREKIRRISHAILNENTNKDPNKMTYSQKLNEVSNLDNFIEGSEITITMNESGIIDIILSTIETGILNLTEVELRDLIENWVNNKAKSCIDRIVKNETLDRLETLTQEEKETLVNNANIKSAYERMIELEG